MKLYKKIILTIGIIFGLGLLFMPSQALAFDNVWDDACTANPDTALCKERDDDKLPEMIRTIVNVLLYVLGAVSIVVIIMAGVFYTLSAGDQNQVTKAKNTLLYAVVGLVVALLAYAIVNFIYTAIT